MPTVTEALERLNGADLSALRAKLDGLRADLEAALKAQGRTPNATATDADLRDAAGKAGISIEDLLAALEAAKRRGLI